MKNLFNRLSTAFPALLVVALMTISTGIFAQVNYSAQAVQVTVKGESTMHDWIMTSSQGRINASFSMNQEKLTGLAGLSFTIPAESLKSEKGSTMDKNAYKALKTGAHKNINFVLTSAKVLKADGAVYTVEVHGNLTIAGSTKAIVMTPTMKWNAADKSFTCSGNYKFKMTQFGMTPPSLMLGAIKVGDDLEIVYNLKINP